MTLLLPMLLRWSMGSAENPTKAEMIAMPLEPHEIKAAHEAVETVKTIDLTIEWLGRNAPEELKKHGEKVRDIFGRNRLSQFTNEHLGEVVLCAVVNALLLSRREYVERANDIVKFPEPPCPVQVAQSESN